jgi:hypothetical protein
MIIATAGPATLAARTASKLPAEAGAGVDVDCWPAPEGGAAGVAFAGAFPWEADPDEDGTEMDGEQAPAITRMLAPESRTTAAALVFEPFPMSITLVLPKVARGT